MHKKTCGELYLETLSLIPTELERQAFAAGFVNGQAEKVYLGACPAAMFRPSEQTYGWLLDVVIGACERYDLRYEVMRTGPDIRELWICRVGIGLGKWYSHEKDSSQWHRLRAEACGIPVNEVDVNFHDRKGYEQPCDQGAMQARTL